jgi:murein DD-endopeptidase MepM/ murein hydrolase activator NlpD
MKNYIAKQRVRPRRQPSPLLRAAARQKKASLPGSGPSGFFMEGIKQKPIHKKCPQYKRIKPFLTFQRLKGSFSPFSGFFGGRGKKKNPDKTKARTPAEQKGKNTSPPFPPSSFPLIVLGGLLFFSILTVTQADFFLKDSFPETNSLELREDDRELQQNLASYAGLTPVLASAADDWIPLDLMETFAWKTYTVRKGDSVSKIALDHAISMDAIIASNNIANARRLREGEILRIPNMDGIPYTLKPGDTLSNISLSMGVPLEVILDANDIQNENISSGTVLFIPGARMPKEDLKLALGELFIYPLRGRLTSPFGWRNDPISGERRYHAAMDLAAPSGTPIKAALDGRINSVGFNSVYGKYIIISHSGGYQTMYAHLSVVSVREGAYAYQNTKIGEVGSTGYSTGPHLHFAIYKNGRAVNPLDLLSP